MADSNSKRHWLPIIIPVALIVVLLPVAVFIGLNNNADEENDSIEPNPAATGTVAASDVSGEGPVIQTMALKFQPQETRAGAGEPVTFQNPEQTTHEVEIDGESYPLESGKSFEWSSDSTGTFDYFCLVHPEMTGTIEVVENDD